MAATKTLCLIEASLARVLTANRFGVADTDKVNKIHDELDGVMLGLLGIDAIHDYAVSVVRINRDTISASVIVKVTLNADFVHIPSQLRTITPQEDSFDRAMKGI